MSNSQARVEAVFAEAAELFASKNISYGDSWREQGWRGNVSRILEKSKRVRNLVWRQSVLLNGSREHPRETMLDMINTLAFAIINMDDSVEWGHEPQAQFISGPAWPVSEARTVVEPPPGTPQPEGDNEVTMTNIPVPGEERHNPFDLGEPPSPKPRPERSRGGSRKVAVTDKGSGPRPTPQA